jgi:hypothetical protein
MWSAWPCVSTTRSGTAPSLAISSTYCSAWRAGSTTIARPSLMSTWLRHPRAGRFTWNTVSDSSRSTGVTR